MHAALSSAEYLVLSSGGMNGLAYIGALAALETVIPVHTHFRGFGGTSAGALVALALTCGADPGSLSSLFLECRDDLRGLALSLRSFELCRGAFGGFRPLDKAVDRLLPAPGVTFQELHAQTQKHLLVVAFNLCTGKVRYFDHLSSPRVRVSTAVLASMAVPFLFPPAEIDGELYVDGAVAAGFPFYAAFPGGRTFGFWLRSSIPHYAPADLLSDGFLYIKTVLLSMVRSDPILRKHARHVVVIPTESALPSRDCLDPAASRRMHLVGFMATFFHLHHHGLLPPGGVQRIILAGLRRGILRVPFKLVLALLRDITARAVTEAWVRRAVRGRLAEGD
jgi:predicted patatin/cPLA2 family phospholipase